MSYLFKYHEKQQGVALFTILVFLVALTLLAITSMRGSTMSERIARNRVDKSIATQAAEAALRDAQSDILWLRADYSKCTATSKCRPGRPILQSGPGTVSNGFVGDISCSDGQCMPISKITTPVWEDPAQWANAVSYGKYTGAVAIPMVSQQPKYLIEANYSSTDGWTSFRISALGYGADSNTKVMLQSIFVPVFQ